MNLCVCVCLMYVRSKGKKKKEVNPTTRKFAVKSNSKAFLGDFLTEILAVTLFVSHDNCSHLISES